MSKTQINIKSKKYAKDKEAFLRDLRQFNESKNVPFKIPMVNGKEIDLYLFYMLVQQGGGLSRVNQTDIWDSFLAPLQLPYPCINGSTLLRKIYGTYLEKYERAKAPAGRDDDNDLDDDPRRGRTTIQRVPMFGGGTYISASGEQLKVGNVSKVGGPPERLALSLLSPMPNEQDFAVNVCTVLAADYANRLPLATTPHILDFLLAHAGVYNHSSLRETIGRSYFETRGRYPDDFWKFRSGGGGVRELVDETKFMANGVEQPELIVTALAAQNTLADVLKSDGDEQLKTEGGTAEDVIEDWMAEPDEESQLFASDFPGGASCVYTQRILQVASIVRSLSFHEDNVHYLANNNTLIRFLLLCANCWVGALRQSGLDTLGNICTELVIKDPATCLISRHILSTIQSSLVSQDRARVLAALEMLNKLSQNEGNEDSLLRSLEAKVYSDVCSLLTLRDIMVLVCTLECVYALTCLGDRACDSVAKVPGLVNTLVCLVTVEAQSYGPRACILMRVVETVSGPSALAATEQQQQQQQSQQQSQQQPQQQSQQQTQQATQQQPQNQTPQKQQPQVIQDSQQQNTNVTSTVVASSANVQPVSSIQQSHMQQRTVQENEHFALAWLRSSYAPLPPSDNSRCDAAEMYRLYLSCCGKLGRKGVIAPAHFPRLVRTVFGGTVGPTTVTTSSGETQQYYIGIKSRNPQPRTGQPPGPASPILKAQLTNKPATTEKPQTQPQIQPQQQSHLTQALDSGASNTTLIKHLLAHKVSPATQISQVAQRQQNQQRVVTPGATNVIQNTTTAMDVDPEALIKCTTIIPGGANAPTVQEKVIISAPEEPLLIPKEEPVQIQIDEQSQLTIKTAQNKMLADLLEKKSNPPVQVVQMGNQMNPPTIQITETGQIVQVKQDPNPCIQINEAGVVSQAGPFFIKNEQGQLIQIKSEQIQHQLIQFKNEQAQSLVQGQMIQGQVIQSHGQVIQSQGQIVQGQGQVIQGQMKIEKEMVDTVVTDHSYTEPPSKKAKMGDKKETKAETASSVSKAAANLYAALAASTLEDEEDLLPTKQESSHQEVQPSIVVTPGTSDNAPVIIQEPMLQVQPQMQLQQQTMQVQPTIQVQQPTLQIPQPMLQVQPMDVQNIIASQPGQIILQEKPMQTQQTQFMQQQMQIIATPSNAQGGLSYIAQNIPGNMMQKTIIIVQGTGGGPLTLTVNNSAGLDEATLNSVIAQATEAITQQQIIQNSGVIQSTQRMLVSHSQPSVVTSQPMTVVQTGLAQSASQMSVSQQPIITSQPQPHKAQIMNQQPQQIMVTQKQPPALIATSSSSQIIQANQIVQSGQQFVQSTPQMVQSTQQMVQSNQQMVQSTQQMVQSTQQMVQSTQQMVQSTQQMVQGAQQVIQVSSNQQIIMNNKGIHRVVTPQRNQPGTTVQCTAVSTVVSDNKPSVIQTTAKMQQQQPARQVIARQPIMVGNVKIGEKEIMGTPAEVVKPPTPKPTSTPPPPAVGKQEETPWICHWRGCGKTFASAPEVFSHAAKSHCPVTAGGEAPCLWLDCDRVPRKTFALLNHLTDKHCSAQALQAVFNSRRHIAAETEPQKAPSVGYPPNAALQALNKHAQDMFNPRELMDENEGPVTKSIRLTAALILRNIVIYSNHGRRQLRSYESHLATIALSSVEASRTVAHILYDMNNI